MSVASALTAALAADLKPSDDELDLSGLTHQGLVRKENQDHFLIGTLHRELAVHGTSLPAMDHVVLRGERFATFAVVADGVGGVVGGAAASQRAVETIANYVQHTLRCFAAADPRHESAFLDALQVAALDADTAVRSLRTDDWEERSGGPATTMTLAIGVWPRAYVVQVGDSRCYQFDEAGLRRVTRDQTLAQDLVDRGDLRPSEAQRSPLQHVLTSALGGRAADPVVSALNLQRSTVFLVCSDGLTRHVSDEELATCLGKLSSAQQACNDLLRLALERGGHDNITIVIGRSRRGDSAGPAVA